MRQMVRIIILLILAIFYILIPFDFIPDRLGRLGRIDDFLILFTIVWWFFFKPLIDEMRGKTQSEQQERPPNTDNSQSERNCSELNAFDVLGISDKATDKEIKKAYHELIRKYHPDLVDTMGEEIKDVARQKTEEINQAYDSIIQK